MISLRIKGRDGRRRRVRNSVGVIKKMYAKQSCTGAGSSLRHYPALPIMELTLQSVCEGPVPMGGDDEAIANVNRPQSAQGGEATTQRRSVVGNSAGGKNNSAVIKQEARAAYLLEENRNFILLHVGLLASHCICWSLLAVV